MNKIILMGNIGNIEDKGNFVKISIATTKKVKDEYQTQWHNCLAFGKIGENFLKYTERGSKVIVEGELTYTTKDKIKYANILISNLEIITWKKDKEKEAEPEENYLASFSDDNIPF